MDNLFVLKFSDEATAVQVLGTLKRLQDQQLIKVSDAAILTVQADGKPKIKQATNLVGAGALGGAFWGLLVGALLFVPILGMAVGAATGALSGKMSDIGISNDFIKQLANSLKPGEAALFLLTSQGVVDKVADELKQYKFQLLQTSLSKENEAKLREMLGTTA